MVHWGGPRLKSGCHWERMAAWVRIARSRANLMAPAALGMQRTSPAAQCGTRY